MLLGLARQCVGDVVQVVFDRMSLTEPYEVTTKLPLAVLDRADCGCDLHDRADAVVKGAGAGPSPTAIFSSRTAATLNVGCFDTGSHAVMVRSLAAVWRPSAPDDSSGSRSP